MNTATHGRLLLRSLKHIAGLWDRNTFRIEDRIDPEISQITYDNFALQVGYMKLKALEKWWSFIYSSNGEKIAT